MGITPSLLAHGQRKNNCVLSHHHHFPLTPETKTRRNQKSQAGNRTAESKSESLVNYNTESYHNNHKNYNNYYKNNNKNISSNCSVGEKFPLFQQHLSNLNPNHSLNNTHHHTTIGSFINANDAKISNFTGKSHLALIIESDKELTSPTNCSIISSSSNCSSSSSSVTNYKTTTGDSSTTTSAKTTLNTIPNSSSINCSSSPKAHHHHLFDHDLSSCPAVLDTVSEQEEEPAGPGTAANLLNSQLEKAGVSTTPTPTPTVDNIIIKKTAAVVVAESIIGKDFPQGESIMTTNLTKDEVWNKLVAYYGENKGKLDMRQMFQSDPSRFSKYSTVVDMPCPDGGGPLFLDFSKNILNEDVFGLLLELLKSRGVEKRRDDMFSAQKINTTENRAVLHVALRARSTDPPINLDGKNVIEDVSRVLNQMEKFCDDVINGTWTGYTGKKITDVVNIGIGGSDLGPCMVSEALTQYRVGPKAHFVSNVDESHLTDVLKLVNPETTLFIIASKTFTTQETITNAKSARQWFLEKAKDEKTVAKHFVALSTNLPKVQEFGISTTFEFWDYVGGRYSLWSAIGLSIALQSGFANFRKMLDGARFMDHHFKNTPAEKNIPVILALIGVWYNSVIGWESHAVLPYDQFLSKLPAYLQQADMESNGKSTTLKGDRIESYNTGPVLWGRAGTNGQHAFYQLLHQGTRIVPSDFIGFVQKNEDIPGISHHSILLANLVAQPEALMVGRVNPSSDIAAALRPHKYFPGNRPTNVIMARKLTPFSLGALIAMYEHKIFVQGAIWDINSYDQWGVELGKELARAIEPELSEQSRGNHDASTQGIIDFILKFK